MDHIVQILRTLFFNIDRVVYEGVGAVYDLLLTISRATILNSETIEGFYGRVYALIGIFMLFKISFSLITYILNPDEFVDKEKGFSSIIKRVIISLVMLVIVPYGFKEAYALQAILLEDNTLASLIFGNVNNNYQIDTAGEKMKFILMYTFFQPNYNGLYETEKNNQLASCAITYQYEDNGMVKETDAGVFTLNSECFGELKDDLYSTDTDGTYAHLWAEDNQTDLYQTYAQGIARQNFNLMFKHEIAMLEKKGSKSVYFVDYMFPLSTAVGVAVLWVLLMFCIDVAVRSVKLGFYQLIAPIPILSYIDPKSKDGMFNKWLKQCGTTYASLFIRLLALYLGIYLISALTSSGIQDVVTGERISSWWVFIFVIIGVLMFAKQLPKILEDTLGFKGTGDFTLNPLKKLEDGMIGGKTIKRVGSTAAAVGVAGGLALGANALTGFTTNKGLGRFKGITSGLAGGFSAMGRAAVGGMKGEKFGKNWASSYGAAMQAKQSRADRKDDHVGWLEMTGAKMQQKMGLHTAGEKAKTTTEAFSNLVKLKDEATSIADKSDGTIKTLLKQKEAYASWDAASSVDKESYYQGDVPDPTTGMMRRVYDEDAYQAAVDKAIATKAERMKQYDDQIDDARASYFQSQGADTAIGQIYAQMNDIIKDNDAAILQALKDTKAKLRDASGEVVKRGGVEVLIADEIAAGHMTLKDIAKTQIKEMGTAGINAKQTYEQSKGTRHAQDVDKYAQKKGQK